MSVAAEPARWLATTCMRDLCFANVHEGTRQRIDETLRIGLSTYRSVTQPTSTLVQPRRLASTQVGSHIK